MSSDPRPGEDPLNPALPEPTLDDVERSLRAAAPAAVEDDGCTLDPPFDAGLIGAWLQRMADTRDDDAAEPEAAADESDDPVAAHLAECEGCRALVPHLREALPPQLVGRMVEAAAPRRRRWITPAVTAAAVALAAVVALFVIRPDYLPPPDGFRAGPLTGGVALDKSSPGTSHVFVPTSRVRWILSPETRYLGVPARVFESAPPGARLVALPDDAVTVHDSGAVELDAPAAQLFGDRYGPRALYLGIATGGEALYHAAGLDPPADGAVVGGVRWFRAEIDYRRE